MARNKLQQEADVALHVLSFNEFSSDDWINHEVLKLNGKISEAKLRYVLSDEHQQLGRLESHHQQEIRRICVPIIDGRIKNRNANNPALLASKAAEEKMQALTDQLAALTADKNVVAAQAIPDPVQAPAPQVAFGAPIEQEQEQEQVILPNVVTPTAAQDVYDIRKLEYVAPDTISTDRGTFKSIASLVGKLHRMYPFIECHVLEGISSGLLQSSTEPNNDITYIHTDTYRGHMKALLKECTRYQECILMDEEYVISTPDAIVLDAKEVEEVPVVAERYFPDPHEEFGGRKW